MTHHRTTLVHLFREHAVFGMQELGVAAGEDAVDLEIFDPGLEFGAELGAQGQALLLRAKYMMFSPEFIIAAPPVGSSKACSVCWSGDRVLLFCFSRIQ